jgi:hypothetical protein
MKIVISDEQFSKIIEEQLTKLSNVNAPSDYLGKNRGFERTISSKKKPVSWNVYQCIPSNMQSIPNYVFNNQNELMSKMNINKSTLTMLTKIAIGIIGRETTFNQDTEYTDDASQFFYNVGMGFVSDTGEKIANIDNVVKGRPHQQMSLGPAQFTKDTWNNFGLDKKVGPFETSFGVLTQGIGVIYTTYDLYKKAIQSGSGTGPSVNPIAMRQGKIKSINGTGNNSLDLAIVSHNMKGMINKWCQTNSPDYAAPCNQKIYQPFKDSKPELKLTVYQNKPIMNYFPNKGTGKLTSIGYLEEVVGYIKRFNCFNL